LSPSPQSNGTADGAIAASLGTIIEGETPFTAYSAYLDGPAFDADAERAHRDGLYRQREAAIVECMAALGFDYYPREPPEASDLDGIETHYAFEEDFVLVPALADARSIVAQYGYGVESPPDLSIYDDTQAADLANTEYREGLGEAGRRAYDLAYQGFDDVTSDVYNPEGKGCLSQAEDQQPWEPASAIEDFRLTYSDLISAFTDVIEVNVALDPRIVELNREWNSCMLGKAVDVGGQMISGANIAWFSTASPVLAYRSAQVEGALVALGDSADAAAIEANRQLNGSAGEMRIALADFDCRQEVAYLSTVIDVQKELEEDFVQANRSALDEMAAATHS
jgi:hypothetical protein